MGNSSSHSTFNVRPSERRRHFSYGREIDILSEVAVVAEGFCVDPQDLVARFFVREWDAQLDLKATGAEQCGVDALNAVCQPNEKHIRQAVDAVHDGKELRCDTVVNSPGGAVVASTAVTKHRVHFVEDNDVQPCLLAVDLVVVLGDGEETPHVGLRLPNVLGHDLGAVDDFDALGLQNLCDLSGDERLPSAGGSIQHDAADRLHANTFQQLHVRAAAYGKHFPLQLDELMPKATDPDSLEVVEVWHRLLLPDGIAHGGADSQRLLLQLCVHDDEIKNSAVGRKGESTFDSLCRAPRPVSGEAALHLRAVRTCEPNERTGRSEVPSVDGDPLPAVHITVCNVQRLGTNIIVFVVGTRTNPTAGDARDNHIRELFREGFVERCLGVGWDTVRIVQLEGRHIRRACNGDKDNSDNEESTVYFHIVFVWWCKFQ
eukprot:PhM_4_TR2852/c0_g1_i1/m.31490